MHLLKRLTIAAVFACLLFGLTGCPHNPGSTLTSTQQVQVNLYATVEQITAVNKQVAQAMVSLNSQKLVADAPTRAVLGYNKIVATAAEEALKILDTGAKTPAEKAQAVIDLLKKLELPGPVGEFVNSNPSVKAVLDTVNLIVKIQQLVATARATPPALLTVTKGAK